jgi:hypothetical protein
MRKVVFLLISLWCEQFDNAILLLYLFFCVYVLDLQESPSGEGKILSIRISNHQFYKLLPVKLDQEQLDELELEAKIQGSFVLFFFYLKPDLCGSI